MVPNSGDPPRTPAMTRCRVRPKRPARRVQAACRGDGLTGWWGPSARVWLARGHRAARGGPTSGAGEPRMARSPGHERRRASRYARASNPALASEKCRVKVDERRQRASRRRMRDPTRAGRWGRTSERMQCATCTMLNGASRQQLGAACLLRSREHQFRMSTSVRYIFAAALSVSRRSMSGPRSKL